MLSRGKVTPATVSYYSDEVAQGIEDYYAGRGEAHGYWIGQGAAAEDLVGEVTGEELARLFDACHPRTGESLGVPYRVRDGVDRVTGWDLTLSAPKSVSVLWAVGGGEIGLEVRDGHEAAVAAAVAYLDEHAAFSRTGKAGIRQVDTHGLVGAAFVHRTSRAGDPQLHTHVLVSGRVRCEDGAWRALDSRALHRQMKPAGMVYQAALRAELTARLGVEWTAVDRNGQAEIVGVPLRLRRLWSQRRHVVEARAEQRIAEWEASLGRALTSEERRRAFEVAVLETRAAKVHGVETDLGLHDRWQAEADAAGLAPVSWIRDTVGHRPALARDVRSVLDDVVAELETARSTWRRADAIKHVAPRTPVAVDGADAARRWIETITDRVLADPRVVALVAPGLDPPTELRRRDGQAVFDRHGATRYTTLDTLAVEQHVLDLAESGRGDRGVAAPVAVDGAVVHAGLSDDQAAVVRTLALGGDPVICVIGPAGSGKTHTMATAATAWQASRIPVRGLTVSAMAAGVLSAEAGIPADTIAKFLLEQERPGGPDGPWRLRRGEVLVVDEAGMVASRDLARLVRFAERADAKVVLVGDDAQLGAIEAGGLFRLLAERQAVELTGIHRFTASWEADASLRLRARDPAVLTVYDEHGRVRSGDRLEMLDAACHTWQRAHAGGESLVVVASDHATVDDLARRIRATRIAAGEIEAGGLTAGEQIVGVGDHVVTTRNDRCLVTTSGGWVRNGDRWQVTNRHPDGTLTVSHLAGHGRARLPADYVAEHVALAYALTVHKAQGVTVDRSLLLVDETTTAEALYVGMTRGRQENTAIVLTDQLDPEHHDPPRPARELLAAALGRTSADEAALDVLRRTLDSSESLAVLAPRLANLNSWLRREAPPDQTFELQRLAHRRTHVEQHAHPGMLTRSRRDDRRLLRDFDQQEHQLEAAQARREAWLDAHADTLAYRDELAVQVATRRTALAAAAVTHQPEHLVELLGPVPDDDHGRGRWATLAGRVEAYREEWGVEPDRLHETPRDGLQYQEWAVAVSAVETMEHLHQVSLSRELSRELDHGLEL